MSGVEHELIACIRPGKQKVGVKVAMVWKMTLFLVQRMGGNTVKPVLSGHSKKTKTIGFKTNSRLMQGKSIAE